MIFYTVKDIANIMNVSCCTIYRWVGKGLLPMIKPGGGEKSTLLISEKKFEQFFEH